MEIIKFDPSIEELKKIVALTSTITAPDLSDDTQIALVHENRIALRNARVKIEKIGKEYRAEALAHQKAVIAREKELIAIIEPEENRLSTLEDQAALVRERAARAALLPMRKEMLAPFGLPEVSDESILDMDNDAFITYLNERQAQKNEQDRLAIEVEKARLAREAEDRQTAENARVAERARIEAEQKAEENARIEKAAQAKRDAEIAAQKVIDDAKAEALRVESEAKEKAAQEAAKAQKALDDAKAEAARIESEAREKVAQEAAHAEAIAREKATREQQAKDDAARKEAEVKYLEWAKAQGWTEATASEYKASHTADGIELWKRIGVFTL